MRHHSGVCCIQQSFLVLLVILSVSVASSVSCPEGLKHLTLKTAQLGKAQLDTVLTLDMVKSESRTCLSSQKKKTSKRCP